MRQIPRASIAVILLIMAAPLPAIESDGPTTRSAAATTARAPLEPGNHLRRITVDRRDRSFLVHVPPQYDKTKPTPVVLAFHGATMNGQAMAAFTGLSDKSDAAGFVVVYPNGTGFGEVALFFNVWATPGPDGKAPVDDVKFTSKLLDDLETVVNVDPKRVFVTGLSNGGMMSHRLAGELSDRIAAVAPVAGTINMPFHPTRPVPVLHMHGTADTIVPVAGSGRGPGTIASFKSVEETIKIWVDLDGCPAEPRVTEIPDKNGDGTSVHVSVYGPGRAGSEVILYSIEGAGHTWPGRVPPVKFLGKSTTNISANDIIWDFFCRHPMP